MKLNAFREHWIKRRVVPVKRLLMLAKASDSFWLWHQVICNDNYNYNYDYNYDYRPVYDIGASLSLTTDVGVLQASDYPFEVNLRDLVHGNLGSSVEINVLGIEELTPSELRTDLSKRVDGTVLRYTPQGNFLHNVLRIHAEIADASHHPTIGARQRAAVYSVTPSGSLQVIPTDRGNVPVEETLAVRIVDDVIGDPVKAAKNWTFQGANGTCLLASVGSALASLGEIDDGYEHLLSRTTVRIDANGNSIDENGNRILLADTGVDILIDGKPPYVEIIEPLTPEYLSKIDPRLRDDLRVGAIMPNPELKQNWGWVKTMFDAYNVPSHTGYASNFATLVQEIQVGNKIIAYVDAVELWRSPFTDFIDGNDWIPFSAERSVENHALWITGVKITDGEPYIIVNDSGLESGRSAEYPLKQFAEAFEDAEFIYTATGATAPDQTIQNQRQSIAEDITNYFAADKYSATTVEKVQQRFNRLLEDLDLLDSIALETPGFKAKVTEYKTAVENQRYDVLLDIGLQPTEIEEIAKIFEDVDVE